MNQQNETFAGNDRINEHIHRQLGKLSVQSAEKITKKITHARDADRCQNNCQSNQQMLQVWRELCFAEYFIDRGIPVECETEFDDLTPDWYAASECMIIEASAAELQTQERRNCLTITSPSGLRPANLIRTANAMIKKAEKYASIVNKYNIKYVIAVHGSSLLATTANDCEQAIVNAKFFDRAYVSGVLFRCEDSEFKYTPNPRAIRPWNSPNE